MAVARSWRQPPDTHGPYPVHPADIAGLNNVFSEAFTERYRRDGMVGVRVPLLSPAIWRYAIEDAGEGAMLWRDSRDEIVAFNVAHHSGVEGWMGPLAVKPVLQGMGLGKEIVRAGIDWLREQGATVIGLETMPRTMDNIGFYARLGFVPARLTLTLTLDSMAGNSGGELAGRMTSTARDAAIEQCRVLTQSLQPGYDFPREIVLTQELSLGDTLLLHDGDDLAGFALFHTAPLVEGRAREELRVLKMVLASAGDGERMARALCEVARRASCQRVAIRIQGDYPTIFETLVSMRARVRWSDLRMTVAGHEERAAKTGVVLSNWEI
jgi:GNAT superfamily N-acetyltransferase